MLKKLSVLVLAFAVMAVFTLPSAANAQFTKADLEAAGITDPADQAVILSLFGSATTTTSSSNRGCSVDYLRDLSVGSQGADVMNLQMFLNDAGYSVSVTGAGSVGMESMYYGAKTAAAVTAYQNANAATVLAPIGLVSGTGYFGAGTRSQVRMDCANMTTPTPNPEEEEEEEEEEDDSLRGGEASLEEFDLESEEDEVEEGEMEHVATAEVDVEDGDVRFSRMDVEFVGVSTPTEDDPWDAFDMLTVMVDGEEVASEEIDDEDDWLRDDSPFVFRLSNLDYVAREGDTVEFEIYLTANSNVDDAGTDASWTIAVDDNGLRAVDSEGIQNYAGDDSDTAEVEIVAEGADDKLTLKNNSDDPEGATIEVDADDESEKFAIFMFDAEVEEDSSDLTLDEVVVSVTFTDPAGGETPTADDIVHELWLEVEGEEVDFETASANFSTTMNASSETVEFTFDLDGLELESDSDEDVEYPFTLVIEFEDQNGNYDIETMVQGLIEADDAAKWDVEGRDDVTVTGSPDGDTHTLALYGVNVELVSESFRNVPNDDGDVGEFTLKFEVTAVGEDLYIDKTQGTAATNGIQYTISSTETPESSSASVTSTADTVSGEWYVEEDETETFTLKVTVNNSSTVIDGDDAAFYQIILNAIQVDDASDDSGEYDVDVSEEDVETDEYYVTDEEA